MLVTIFKMLFIASAGGFAATVLLALLSPVSEKFFSAKWNYYIWFFVLLIMIFPIKINLPEASQKQDYSTFDLSGFEITAPGSANSAGISYSEPDIPPQTEKSPDSFLSSAVIRPDLLKVIGFVWICVAVLLFIFKIIAYETFLMRLKRHSIAIECPEIRQYTNRKIKVVRYKNINSPFMVGLFRPRLVLPDVSVTGLQLDNILKHEMTHFRRHDIFIKWFAMTVKCLHWFNPAVYFACRRLDMWCEISCDIAATKTMDFYGKKDYTDTILYFLKNTDRLKTGLTTCMAKNINQLKRRFIMIKTKNKPHPAIIIISVIAAIAILAVAAVGAGILNGNTDSNDIIAGLNTDVLQTEARNFLLVGADEDGRADTILLVLAENGNISLRSIPRDTGIDTSAGKTRISAILKSENGDRDIIDAVRNTLSVPVHYYARFNLSAVEKIVDVLGGVEIDVPQDMVYSDPYQNLEIDIKQGKQILSGKEACNFLRFRRYPDGDLSRVKMQQMFVRELIKQKFTSEYADKGREIYKIISENIFTNYSETDLLRDMKKFENIKADEISFSVVPGENRLAENNGFFYEINKEAMQ